MNQLNYRCPKCQGTEYEVDQMRATGGILTKVFDVQSKKFTTVFFNDTATTEIYTADSSMLGNIFDFFTQ
jgi:predicted nucleic-acid-binding Zn-ribbon protein